MARSHRPTGGEGGSIVARQARGGGFVKYVEAEAEYFTRRALRRHAAFWSIWALGVGAVISGDFYGWNVGLVKGGLGGLLIATAVVAVMYYGLVYSIAEMAPALPHTGGAYSFSRSAMGPWGGFVTGLAENMEYVITPAVVVAAMGLLMQSIMVDLFDISGSPWWNSEPFWWALFYVIFVGINVIGIEATMRVTIFVTVLALAVLAFFYLAALVSGKIDTGSWFNVGADNTEVGNGDGSFLPNGVKGIFQSLPFAIWFYLAIEELPLASEESVDPARDMPKAARWGMHTLLIASILTLFVNAGLDGGAFGIGNSGTPLFDGFKGIFGDNVGASLLALIGLIGLIASFFTIIYAYGRNTYSLSRAGYFPRFLSVTHGTRQTPHVALVAGAIVGYFVVWLQWKVTKSGGSADVVAAVLNMAVFAAVISYALQCAAFILLRRNLPNIARPYRSPWGIPGAAIAGVIALVSLVSIFLNEDYRPGVYGVAIYYVLGIVYFAIVGRHRLVLSPEEEFAMTLGEHGHPETEGYGRTHVSDVGETAHAAGSGPGEPTGSPPGGVDSTS
jgi:ethanolamine permease